MIYTTIGKPREDDPLYPVYVQFERFRAAQYSRELSDKVWRGCMKISEQGYWSGGPPPYAMQRLLLDEKREPLHTLQPGQRKGIQNQRVTMNRTIHSTLTTGQSPLRPDQADIAYALRQRYAAGRSLVWSVAYLEDQMLALAAMRAFRSWKQAIQAAKIPTAVRRKTPKWSAERIITCIQLRYQEGLPLEQRKVAQEDQRLVHAARRYFGSWSAALIAAGIE